MLTRRQILAGLMITAALPACAEAPATSPRPQGRPLRGAVKIKAQYPSAPLAQIVREAGISGTHSIVVADARTGRVLEEFGGAAALPPASVTKSVTALYALYTLGPGHRYATRVIGTGPVADGVLKGDLILAGGGDPHLDTDGLVALARDLKARGVSRIVGEFRVWSGALPYQRSIDPGQPDHLGYNPAISGLNLNFNRVYFEWKRAGNGYRTTMDARTDRHRPAVRGIDIAVQNRGGALFTYSDKGGRESWTVRRNALGKAGGRWLPVRRPDTYAGEVFRTVAAAQGVSLPSPRATSAQPKGTVLAEQASASLGEQVRAMLKYSTNLTAEVTGLSATVHRGGAARSLAASAKEMTRWLRQTYGVTAARFDDHSGLGPGSRISAAEMCHILSGAGWNGPLRPFLKDIPLVNANGKRAPIEGVAVVAKTGTLNFVSALSGYIDCPNGDKLAFAIFSADLQKRRGLSKSQRERPEGGARWRKRAKAMQQKLLRRWALEYGVTS